MSTTFEVPLWYYLKGSTKLGRFVISCHPPLVNSPAGRIELLPLQVFWCWQTLQFWNSLDALPAGSFYHTVCLDNLTDAFRGGCLQYG